MDSNRFLTFGSDVALYLNANVYDSNATYQTYTNLNESYRVEDGSGDAGMPNEPMIVNDNNNNNNNNDDGVGVGIGEFNCNNNNDDEQGTDDEQKACHEFVIQPETIFVTGMSQSVSKHDIEMLFSRAGTIRVDEITGKPRIFAYKNKYTGQSRGEATVTYTDANAAHAAIIWLNETLFCGKKINVHQAYVSYDGGNIRYDYLRPRQPQLRRNRKKVWRPAADNWVCSSCRNSNFVWRVVCNRCKGRRSECELGRQRDIYSNHYNNNNNARHWRPLKSDWQCGFCFNTNFWHRNKCNRCKSPKDELSDQEPRLCDESSYANC